MLLRLAALKFRKEVFLWFCAKPPARKCPGYRVRLQDESGFCLALIFWADGVRNSAADGFQQSEELSKFLVSLLRLPAHMAKLSLLKRLAPPTCDLSLRTSWLAPTSPPISDHLLSPAILLDRSFFVILNGRLVNLGNSCQVLTFYGENCPEKYGVALGVRQNLLKETWTASAEGELLAGCWKATAEPENGPE